MLESGAGVALGVKQVIDLVTGAFQAKYGWKSTYELVETQKAEIEVEIRRAQVEVAKKNIAYRSFVERLNAERVDQHNKAVYNIYCLGLEKNKSAKEIKEFSDLYLNQFLQLKN